jgi:hypothetical protein
MDTTESSAPHAHPSTEYHDDTVEAHLACLVGSLLNRDVHIERVSSSHSIKQRSQLRRRGRLRPRPPKAPQHYPWVQPALHLPQS